MKLWNFLAQDGLKVTLEGDPESGYIASIAPFEGRLFSMATTAEVRPRATGFVPRVVLSDLAAQLQRCRVVHMCGSKTVTTNNLSVD